MTTEDWRRFREVGGLDQFRRYRPTDAAAIARRAWAVKCLALALEEYGDRGWQAGTRPEWPVLVKLATQFGRSSTPPLTARELEDLAGLNMAEALTGMPADRVMAAAEEQAQVMVRAVTAALESRPDLTRAQRDAVKRAIGEELRRNA